MQNAKSAVKDFLSKDGKHDTTVHESHAPAVTNETVNKHHHEHVTTATDREVHQDHYHTSVLPVNHTEKLSEQHHHKTAPVEHRKFEHGNDDDVQRRLQTESAKFKDTTVQGDTKHTSSVQPSVTGEHIHHHVHEKIQPVINRQTIEPHVTHHTVPVHEVHHSAAQHHEASALPAMSMSEFTKKHGTTEGSDKPTTQYFQGEPRDATGHVPYRDGDARGEFRHTGHVDQHGHGNATNATGAALGGAAGSGLAGSHHKTGAAVGAAAGGAAAHHHNTSGTSSGLDSDRNYSGTSGTTGSGLTGSHHNTGSSGLTGSNTTGSSGYGNTTGSSGYGNTTGSSGYGNTSSTTGGRGIDSTDSANLGTTGSNTTTSSAKPSLIDRINPFKDSDGDGKKGMMD